MSFVVGLTGGIGSGKSAAAERFAAQGAAIVDTDVIARELTAAGGAGIAPIRAAFGAAVIAPDGSLDRVAMRRIVFTNPSARGCLEAILHPLIRVEGERQCRLASADFPYVLLVVPLLVEAGNYRDRVDRICVVDCPEDLQIARVMARSGLSSTDVEAILVVQASRVERLAVADDIIDNSSGHTELFRQVDRLHEKYREMAKFRQESARTP